MKYSAQSNSFTVSLVELHESCLFLFLALILKGAKYDIENINIAANDYLPSEDIVE